MPGTVTTSSRDVATKLLSKGTARVFPIFRCLSNALARFFFFFQEQLSGAQLKLPPNIKEPERVKPIKIFPNQNPHVIVKRRQITESRAISVNPQLHSDLAIKAPRLKEGGKVAALQHQLAANEHQQSPRRRELGAKTGTKIPPTL